METKQPSPTERFKLHLQHIIKEVTGVTVSKQKAWDLFKSFHTGALEFTLREESNTLSLAGVGTYKILKSEPRGKKAGLDAEGNPIEGAKFFPFVPRVKFYYSSTAQKIAEQFFDLEDHGLSLDFPGMFKSEPKDAA